ncbi:MAG: hypothetical protein EA338_02535 [Roseinatronobacter sp.]|nr:MAG: hypothetical protein EA338_02535 [Roseinatronobacter sp.]
MTLSASGRSRTNVNPLVPCGNDQSKYSTFLTYRAPLYPMVPAALAHSTSCIAEAATQVMSVQIRAIAKHAGVLFRLHTKQMGVRLFFASLRAFSIFLPMPSGSAVGKATGACRIAS